jgi:hypothetical protein
LVAIEGHLEVEEVEEHARDCGLEVLEAPKLCVRLEKEERHHDPSVEEVVMQLPPLVSLEA